MEDHKNISSEQELLELRRQGKITEGEYEELRAAMQILTLCVKLASVRKLLNQNPDR